MSLLPVALTATVLGLVGCSPSAGHFPGEPTSQEDLFLEEYRGKTPADVPQLVRDLHHAEESVRQQAAYFLCHLGDHAAPAVPLLRQQLRDRSPAMRMAAALALGRIGSAAAAAIPDLRTMAEADSDSDCRAVAHAARARLQASGPGTGPEVSTNSNATPKGDSR